MKHSFAGLQLGLHEPLVRREFFRFGCDQGWIFGVDDSFAAFVICLDAFAWHLLLEKLVDGAFGGRDTAGDNLTDLRVKLDLTGGVNATVTKFGKNLAVASTAPMLF